jgi:hypothetical protein
MTPTISSPTSKASYHQSQETMTLAISSPSSSASNNQSQDSMTPTVSSPASKVSNNRSQGSLTPVISSPTSKASAEPLQPELESPNRSTMFYNPESNSVLSPITQNNQNSTSNQDRGFGSSPSFHVLDVNSEVSSILSPAADSKIQQTCTRDENNTDYQTLENESEFLSKFNMVSSAQSYRDNDRTSFENQTANTILNIPHNNADIEKKEQTHLSNNASMSPKFGNQEEHDSPTTEDASHSPNGSNLTESTTIATNTERPNLNNNNPASESTTSASSFKHSDSRGYSKDEERIKDELQFESESATVVNNPSESEKNGAVKGHDTEVHNSASNPIHKESKPEQTKANHNQCCTIS